MTYEQALDYLSQFSNYEHARDAAAMRAIKLERMRELCERLGGPQRRVRSVLVAGTNAKGSICAMIYEILRSAGLPAGLYTSPHLEHLRERIRVSVDATSLEPGADWISEAEFAEAVAAVKSALVDPGEMFSSTPPTYFELVTAAAFWHFARRGVKVAVLEVGLGGRLDATNVADPAISILGPIGFDHTDILGEELATIAWEKAGIMRPQRTIISAPQEPAVAALLRDLAVAQRCQLLEYGTDLSAEIVAHGVDGIQLAIQGLRGRYEDIRLPLIGRHQAQNAALAVAAVESLSVDGAPHEAIRAGLARTRWPGRLQVVQGHATGLFDGAHNPQAAHALRRTVEELWPDTGKHVLLGMSVDKPIEEVAGILAPLATTITCSHSRHPRACPAPELARRINHLHANVSTIPDPVDAYTYLLNTVPDRDLIIVAGSLFLVGELHLALRRAQGQSKRRRSRRAPAKESSPCP